MDMLKKNDNTLLYLIFIVCEKKIKVLTDEEINYIERLYFKRSQEEIKTCSFSNLKELNFLQWVQPHSFMGGNYALSSKGFKYCQNRWTVWGWIKRVWKYIFGVITIVGIVIGIIFKIK